MLDYKPLRARIKEVLKENGEYKPNGFGMTLLKKIDQNVIIKIEDIYYFPLYYGVSLDYLLGRTDTYAIF